MYVDDILIILYTGNSPTYIKKFITIFVRIFILKDLDYLSYFLGIKVQRGTPTFSFYFFLLTEIYDRHSPQNKHAEYQADSYTKPIQGQAFLDDMQFEDVTHYRSIM